VHLVNN